MDRRELVKAAIQHRQAGRVPYFMDICADAWEALQEQGLTEGKSQTEFVDNDVMDIAVPWWGWHELAEDWTQSDFPKSPAKCIGLGNYTDLAKNIKELRQQTDKYFLVRIYGSHFEKAYFARGIENFLADMAGEPLAARKFLTKIIDQNIAMLENFLAIPEIDGVLLGSDWGSQLDLLMSPATWEEMIRPGEAREYDLIHSYGKDVWVHSCGNIERIIPSLVEMHLDVLNPIQPEAMDIAKLKKIYGAKLTFWGGISTQKTLPYGTPEQVKEESIAVSNIMSSGGGYIFGPAQGIQRDVPAENIMALLKAARALPVASNIQ
jgi:uroporphyrinogen decarboxylase